MNKHNKLKKFWNYVYENGVVDKKKIVYNVSLLQNGNLKFFFMWLTVYTS